MPTILRIINRLNVGGPTYNVAYLSRYIRADYETKVLAGYKEPDEANSEYILQDLNIPYQYVPGMHRSLNMKNDWRAYQFIKNEIERYRPISFTHTPRKPARWEGSPLLMQKNGLRSCTLIMEMFLMVISLPSKAKYFLASNNTFAAKAMRS
jgi:hypothetical protein